MSGPVGSSQWMYSSSTSFFSHTISQSLRFEDGDSPSLTFTPSSSGNRKTWTLSLWVKRANITAAYRPFFSAGTSGTSWALMFSNEEELFIQSRSGGSNQFVQQTANFFRDVSAWYHIVYAFDTTQATDTNRSKLYVNGEQLTLLQHTSNAIYPNQDTDYHINNSSLTHYIGYGATHNGYFDGYLAEVNFIDGIQYDASYFGETKDGVWIPKAYSGSYGTYGWRLDFADSSDIGNNANTTDGTNDWTVSGGGSPTLVASDVVSDSPSNNWCVLNRLKTNESLSINQTFSEGNLDFTSSEASSNPAVTSTFAVTSGKWYWEVYIRNYGNTVNSVGIASNPNDLESDSSALYSKTTAYSYQANGSKHNNSDASYGDTWTTGDIISVALDLDAGAVYFYKNGTIQNSGTAAFTSLSGEFTSYSLVYSDGAQVYNFGQDDSFAGNKTSGTAGASDSNGLGTFYYSVPSGYNSLCASNLPDVTIGPGQSSQADDHFNTVLYTGDDSTQAITGVGFDLSTNGGLVWIKNRSATSTHRLYNSLTYGGPVSAGSSTNYLASNSSIAETASASTLISLDSDGFTVHGSGNDTNDLNETYVAWNWKAGTAFSNSAGANDATIASSGSVNTTAGFSIVTYTGDNASGASKVAHGLGAAPSLVIVKRRDTTGDWIIGHNGLAANAFANYKFVKFSTDDTFTNSKVWGSQPTSTVVQITTATNVNNLNGSGATYVMYSFAEIEGYSKVGSYIGNANTDGPFIFTGFRPAFVIMKVVLGGTGNWFILDTTRSTFNEADDRLNADATSSESTGNADIDFLSNGFKIRTASSAGINQNTDTHIYIAFAEAPFKFSNAR